MFGKKNKLPPQTAAPPAEAPELPDPQAPAAQPPSEELPAAEKGEGAPLPPESGQVSAMPPAKRKKKLPKGDDGRTIAEMNVEGMPWYNPTMGKVKDEDKPTRKEKRAMMRAGYLAYLPAFFIALLGFTAAVLIIYLWLHGWTF